MTCEVHQGMSLREAMQLACEMGIDVQWPKATGEVLFIHAVGRARVNSRRKDASKELVSLLRRVMLAINRGVGRRPKVALAR